MPYQAQIKGKLKFFTKPYGRQWKWRYQKDGAFYEPKLIMPEALKNRNIEIIDPLNPKPKETKPEEKWIPARRHPLAETFFSPPDIRTHEDYHDKPIFLCDRLVKLHAGIPQACLLTKSMPIMDLPEKIKSKMGKNHIKDQNDLLKTFVQQALAFHATKEPIKQQQIPSDVKYKIGKQWATSDREQMSILVNNMINLCMSSLNRPNDFITRKLLRGDELIHIRRNTDTAIYSQTPVDPIVDSNLLKQSQEYKFLDMYPIFPTIDFTQEHVFKDMHSLGLNSNSNYRHVDTIIHLNNDNFKTEEDLSRLILFAFGYAHASYQQNKDFYSLDEHMNLSKPITIKAISVSNQRYNFVLFQLNTLSLTHDKGVKNLVFIDGDNELYLDAPNIHKLPYLSKINLQRYALRKLKLNEETFEKFKALIV